MSYLLTQMFLYMAATFLLGLLLGWLIWRMNRFDETAVAELRAERNSIEAERERLRLKNTSLNADLEACRAAQTASAAPLAVPVAVPLKAANAETAPPDSSRPEGLAGPRDGLADNLQDIHGVGPKLERLLHDLGYFHFDQIADWTSEEVAWVDHNLEGFKGRVTRDEWVPQARRLAGRA
ncbi:MAG: hypothetical protein AAFR35_07685 [Pseudomonadota bacterium]